MAVIQADQSRSHSRGSTAVCSGTVACRQVVEQGIGQVLGAVSQAGSIVQMLQAHFAAKVGPLLENVPHMAQLCSRGFAAMLRATEDHIVATMEVALSSFFQAVSSLHVIQLQNQDCKAVGRQAIKQSTNIHKVLARTPFRSHSA